MADLDVFYLAISGLQKAIRRGYKTVAVSNGFLAWREDAFRLHKRMYTILFEECGADIEALLAYKRVDFSYKDWKNVLDRILIMVAAKKSFEPSFLSRLMVSDEAVQNGLEHVRSARAAAHKCLSCLPAVSTRMSELEEKRYDVYLDEKLGSEDLVKFCEYVDTKWDRERLEAATPLFDREIVRTHNGVWDEAGVSGDHIYKGVCLAAMDIHTRVGGFVLGKFMNKFRRELRGFGFDLENKREFGVFVFYFEGRLQNNKYEHSFFGGWEAYVEWRRTVTPMWVHTEAGAWFKEQWPILNEYRRYAFDNNVTESTRAQFVKSFDHFDATKG